ncbi:M48 family metallopeptidase [Pseudomonas sp. Marseille-QA0892]
MISGWFSTEGRSSRQVATLHRTELGLEARGAGGAVLAGPSEVDRLDVSSRIGNTPRFVRFPGEGSFETPDNDGVDRLTQGERKRSGLAHRLESSWRYVAIGLIVTVLFAWGGIRYGVPAGAHALAFALPESVSRQVGDGALAALDQGLLSPSRLPEQRQAQLRKTLMDFAQHAAPELRVEVVFRDARESIGPNALALPSGTIVFTDQLVELAANDEQLIGVMAHEMGHVDRRHALRRLIQSSALGVLAMAVVGDVSSVSSIVAAVPVILTELGYSRDFEYEADHYAALALDRTGRPASLLADILSRLERTHCDESENACSSQDGGQWRSYVSTHPATAERIQALKQAAP